MDSTREGLYCKAMSIVSTVYGIMLWASSFPSPMQTTTREESFVSPKYPFNFGINTLMYLGKEMPRSPNNGRPRILHSNMIRPPLSLLSSSSSSSSSSCSSLFPGTIHTASSLSSWSSSLTGDLIGSESGVYTSPNEDMIANEEMERSERRYSGRSSRVKQRNQRYEKGEYPPSIPSLARTGNLAARMPWVLTRHYIDGRLIFKMQKVKRREYFKADRSNNGRLVLKLIPFDDTVTCCHHDPVDHENNWPRGEIEDDLNLIEEENNNKTDSEEEEEEEEEEETNGHVDVDHGREDEVYGILLEKVVDGASHSQERKKTALTSFACSVPKSCRENRWENGNDQYGRLCFTYAGKTGFELLERLTQQYGDFSEAQAGSLILSHSAGSSPLSLGRIPPLASVV